MRGRSGTRSAVAVAALATCAAACAAREPEAQTRSVVEPVATIAAPSAGTVTIEMSIDNPYALPLGTFEVTGGSDTLGCTNGRFVRDRADTGPTVSVLTCETGSRSGSFSMTLERWPAMYTATPALPDHFAGDWAIRGESGDFEGLTGVGELFGSDPFPAMAETASASGVIWFAG